MGRDMRAMDPTELLFWGVMSLGVIAGFATGLSVERLAGRAGAQARPDDRRGSPASSRSKFASVKAAKPIGAHGHDGTWPSSRATAATPRRPRPCTMEPSDEVRRDRRSSPRWAASPLLALHRHGRAGELGQPAPVRARRRRRDHAARHDHGPRHARRSDARHGRGRSARGHGALRPRRARRPRARAAHRERRQGLRPRPPRSSAGPSCRASPSTPTPSTVRCPGPRIHPPQGDRVRINVTNQLPENDHRSLARPDPAERDGRSRRDHAGADRARRQVYRYEFTAAQSGTYFYHSHDQARPPAGARPLRRADHRSGPRGRGPRRPRLRHPACRNG